MALRALNPAPKVPLPDGWELLATEAGRSNQGLRVGVQLFNGDACAYRTLLMGDPAAQQTLAAAFADIATLPQEEIIKALIQLAAAVEGILRQMADQDNTRGPSQATRLVELAVDADVELFHTPESEAFATMTVEGHRETWPLKVKGFRRWLARQFYTAEEKAPGSQAVQDALAVLEGKALFDGSESPVYTRCAEYQGAIYLDLANEHWQAIEITTTGWQVVADPPIKFRRARGILPLPTPKPGGTIENLRPFINIAGDDDWRLLISWLIAAIRPTGPYPVLTLYGEQGSAKSSLARVLRQLIDPNEASLRTIPRDERDLIIAASNGWLIALDNLSHLPIWLSDALCRIATGGGFATRELYTDAEEAIFNAQRPIAINGIEELATRGDLLDRAILLYLPTIPEDKRREEEQFWQDFEGARPQILGALLDVVSAALCNLTSMKLARLPRMADFAKWSCAAAAPCGWTAEDFLDTYTGNRDSARDITLEASPVALLIRKMMMEEKKWEGTISELLATLEGRAGEKTTRQKSWPKSPRALSNTLRRLAPTLRATGVHTAFERTAGGSRQRIIQLQNMTTESKSDTTTPILEKPTDDEREHELF